MRYTRQDTINALTNVGLAKGDTVFLSTSLGMLGIAENVTSSHELNLFFFDCIREVLGAEGTILVPTYSYTFGPSTLSHPATFDPDTTPSAIGPFPDFFRQQPGVVRTLDPMVSVSGLGPACEQLFKDLPPTSYGRDCFFARLAVSDAYCCSIGLGPNWTPFIHHSGWLHQVPYRHCKLFSGNILNDGKLIPTNWVYSVRMAFPQSKASGHEVGRLATEAGLWKFAPLGRAKVCASRLKDYFKFTHEATKAEPWVLAFGPKCDPLEIERDRIGHVTRSIELQPKDDPGQILSLLAPLPRYAISAESSAVLTALQTRIPMQIHNFPTGTHAFDWIVPERWTPKGATITDKDGQTILSTELGNLQIQFYSISYKGQVSREQLLNYLHSAPEIPDAIPFRQVRGKRDWGLCCSLQQKNRLLDDSYNVEVETVLSYDQLQVGEVEVLGRSERTLLILSYMDDAFQVNARLSGVIAGVEALRMLQTQSQHDLTFRLLILPGPEGLAVWLAQNQDKASQVVGAIALCMLAGSEGFILDSTHDPEESEFVRHCHSIVKEQQVAITRTTPNETEFDWLLLGDNPVDTPMRSQCRFPVATLARTLPPDDPDFPFHGYGTDLDNTARLDSPALDESIRLLTSLLTELAILL